MPRLFLPRRLIKRRRPLSEISWATLHELDEALLDAEMRSALQYEPLRRKLNTVPRAERGLDWTERVIALYRAFGLKRNRSQTLKLRIRLARLDAGEGEAWRDFEERLVRIIALRNFESEPRTNTLAQCNQDALIDDLKFVFELLNRLGYRSFINCGTLLGACREGSFVGHDDDVDLAVLIDGKDDETVVDAIYQLCATLNESGALSGTARMFHSSPYVKVHIPTGVGVDLFAFWMRNGRAYIWPHTFGELTEDDIFPLTTRSLNGVPFPAPKEPEKMLAVTYGEGWKTPDPDYTVPWDEAKRRFASVLDIYAARQEQPSKVRRILAKTGIKLK